MSGSIIPVRLFPAELMRLVGRRSPEMFHRVYQLGRTEQTLIYEIVEMLRHGGANESDAIRFWSVRIVCVQQELFTGIEFRGS